MTVLRRWTAPLQQGGHILDTPIFEIDAISKSYDGHTLVNQAISFQIQSGSIWGLFGPNGAGKTTLIRQMLGLLKPDSGRVRFVGQDVSQHTDAIPRRIGYLPQSNHALWDFTVAEALYFTGRLRGMGEAGARAQSRALISTWELGALSGRVVRRLSGGQQRLVQLAAILMGDPDVLVLDEPTNHMDPAFRRRVWSHLRRLNREQGVTILLVTHNLLEAQAVVSDMAIIDHGRLLVQGTPAELQAGLDHRVYIELAWAHPPDITRTAALSRIAPDAEQLDSLRWRISCERAAADALMTRLLQALPPSTLAELRMHTSSLEDYYLAVTHSGAQRP